MLIDRDDIIIWRRNYLRTMKKYREEGRKIYYLDETWLNEGHTVAKAWQDQNVKTRRQAFLEGFSTGLKAPSGKGRRLIITHIGSDSGFVEGGLLLFESKSTGDYHEDMNAARFEEWFKNILGKIEIGSVIVLDNASYHTRKAEELPTSAWTKLRIQCWLTEKNISYDANMLKRELLHLANIHKEFYKRYVIDTMATEYGMQVLRLPPYHCELNPIELIWAQVKGTVARNNVTFKMAQLKPMLEAALSTITAESWKKCIEHVKKVEERMWELDISIEVIVEPLVINLKETEEESSSDSDF